MNHDTQPCALEWSGLGEVVCELPRPPPTCPSITIDVGMLFAEPPPAGVKVSLFARLIRSPPVAPKGTVITTGDQAGAAAATAPLPVPSLIVIAGAAV